MHFHCELISTWSKRKQKRGSEQVSVVVLNNIGWVLERIFSYVPLDDMYEDQEELEQCYVLFGDVFSGERFNLEGKLGDLCGDGEQQICTLILDQSKDFKLYVLFAKGSEEDVQNRKAYQMLRKYLGKDRFPNETIINGGCVIFATNFAENGLFDFTSQDMEKLLEVYQ